MGQRQPNKRVTTRPRVDTLRPTNIDFEVDPANRECLITFSFDDRRPVQVALPALDLHVALTKAAMATFRSQN